MINTVQQNNLSHARRANLLYRITEGETALRHKVMIIAAKYGLRTNMRTSIDRIVERLTMQLLMLSSGLSRNIANSYAHQMI